MALNVELIIPVVATVITVAGTIIVALINRGNKPVRDILKRTKVAGNGNLADALGVLQKQLKEEQIRYDKQLKDSQQRHEEEIAYYVEQLRISRKEIRDLRHEKDMQIEALRIQLEDHESRLNKQEGK